MTSAERATRADLLLARRAGRIADELENAAADGWLVYDFRGSNPAFGRLLSLRHDHAEGAPAPSAPTQSTRRAFLFIPRRGEPRMLIHHVDAGNFARLGLHVTPYGSRHELLEQLEALVSGARRVLMEYSPGNAIPYVSRVDAGTLDLVRALGVEVLSSADALASVVAAWDAADLASHQRAAQGLERAKDGLFSAIRSRLAIGATWSEFEAQQHLVGLMQEEGLEFDHPPIVAVGPHAGDPHYAPDPELALPIQAGDLVLVDLWAREAQHAEAGPGAYADITWMATAADFTPYEQIHVWESVRNARDAAVRFLEERVRAQLPVQGSEVDQVARSSVAEAGYAQAFTHRTGHSIGWHTAHGDGVNIDDFETHDTRLVRPGAAFSIEPGVYLPSFGVRSEINVVITPGGQVKVTTPPQTELVRLVLQLAVCRRFAAACSTWRSRSARSNGFWITPSARRASEPIISIAYALTTMTGMSRVGLLVFNSCNTSKPDFSGIARSSRMTSGSFSSAISRPALPSDACTTE
jgi:Xaa-Pro dipeptidase